MIQEAHTEQTGSSAPVRIDKSEQETGFYTKEVTQKWFDYSTVN